MTHAAMQSPGNIDGIGRQGGRLVAWAKLLAGVAVILFVMFGIGPLLLRLEWYGEMNRFIEAEGIRSTAIYYTDLETFASAEFALRQRMDFGPRAKAH